MSLQQALERLRVPHPAIQAAAVAAVFELAAQSQSAAQRDAAVAECLSHSSPAVVEAAVQALLAVEAGPAAATADLPQDLLLTALSVAGRATAGSLAGGILRLYERQLSGKPPEPAQPLPPAAWRAHLLSRALLSNAAAAQTLVLGAARLLARAAENGSSLARFVATLAALRPFLSFLLLDPQLAAAQPLLPGVAHSAVARVACCAPDPAAQLQLLRLLVAHLPALRLTAGDPSGAQQAAAAVADVMDVREGCAEEPGADIVGALVGHLVCLCHEAAAADAPALLQQLLSALSLLADHWPGTVAVHAASLGVLLLQHPAACMLGAAETQAALALLATLLQHLTREGCAAVDCRQLAALLLLPLLQHAAFGSSKQSKQWAGHVLALLGSVSAAASKPSSHEIAAPQPFQQHGAAAAVHVAQQLLARLWQRPLEAQHWLASLRLALSAPAGNGGSRDDADRASRDQQQLDRGALLVACALLQHPADAVQRAALRSLMAAMAATPLLGVSLLPLLVHQLQYQVERFLSGKLQRPPRQLLEALRALSEAGRHPAALPFVLRTLQPLLAAGSPEIVQAAGMRMLCRLWRTSGGRAYQHLRAAVIGFAAPGQLPGLPLRMARAECLRDICSTDPDKAVELVGLIQECLADESPAVEAAGLDCVALLCEADVLEFYAAWRVVHHTLPRLPEHPAAAAAWVRLLGGGGFDAAVQPDAAAAIVDALWLAAAHGAPQVRSQAYAALAAFSFDTLEGIEARRPLGDYAALLHSELLRQQDVGSSKAKPHTRLQCVQAAALAECEALVQAALAYEHAVRRHTAARVGGTRSRDSSSVGPGAAGSGAAAMAHRLHSTVPKQLLGGSAVSAANLLQRLPELPAVAVQLLFAPPPPPAANSKAAAASAARHAAAQYQAVFQQLLRQPAATPNAAENASEAEKTLAAWGSFCRRWVAAERAAGKQPVSSQQQAAADAAMQVWAAVEEELKEGSGSTPASVANAVWAAAALCLATQQPLPILVTAVHSRLSSIAAGSQQHSAAAQRAAVAALGSLAEVVRQSLGAPAVEALLQLLQDRSSSLQPTAHGSNAAALTGMGLACAALCSSASAAGSPAAAAGGNLPPAVEQLVRSSLSSVVASLCASWPGDCMGLNGAALQAGLPPVSTQLPSASELLPSTAAALAAALPAASTVLPLSPLLAPLVAQLSTLLQQPAEDATAAAALCTLTEAAVAAGFASGCVSADNVSSTLSQLLSLAGSHTDGRIVGPAAAAAGRLLAAVLRQGFAPTEQQSATAVLQQLLAVPAGAQRLPQGVAAKRGAAAGVAALLEAGAIDGSSQHFRAAVTALEGLALSDSDPRTRRACALPLAMLCHAVKRAGGLGAGAAAAGSDPRGAHKGLSQLPADGALRPLLESLLEGRWVLPQGAEAGAVPPPPPQLSATETAALLRCLAAVERLPALNYGMLCRRLLRSHSSDAELYAAVAVFVAAQGSRQQQQYHLPDLAAELLSQASQGVAPAWQLQALLEHLPQLLAAVPEAQALATLDALCLQAAAVDASGRQALLLPLLRAVESLLADSVSPALQRAAQRALLSALLPALPLPSRYPLVITPGPDVGVPLSHQQRCWAAALQCLRLLSVEQLESALQQPAVAQHLPLHAAATASALVAGGKLDARALQHPRNLLLGSGGEDKQLGLTAILVGRAVGTLPAGQLQQWLLDLLEACKASGSGAASGSFKLAACILGSAATASVYTSQLAAEHVLCAGSACEAVLSLPATLPLLLESHNWQHRHTAALLLQQLAAGLPAEQPADERQLLRKCLLAARGWLPAEMWPLLASLL